MEMARMTCCTCGGDHVAEMELLIYNRQGQKVFHGQNQDLGWDGTFRGEHLPSGVYGYYLRATCVDGAKHTEQGDINLLR
jgi:gliding motility-associated-like protein